MDFQIITNEHAELQEMGLSCMRGLVEKFGEKLVNILVFSNVRLRVMGFPIFSHFKPGVVY